MNKLPNDKALIVLDRFTKCELKNIFDFHNEKVILIIAKQSAKQIVTKVMF